MFIKYDQKSIATATEIFGFDYWWHFVLEAAYWLYYQQIICGMLCD
jgi:hypothetical protein